MGKDPLGDFINQCFLAFKPVAWNAFPMAFEILDAEKSSRFPSRLIMQMSAVFIRLCF